MQEKIAEIRMPHITKQFKFCAAHKYWNDNWSDEKNKEIFEDDIRIHGHNYELDITISGIPSEDSGFIVNISELKKIVDENVISILDHSQINEDVLWFKNKQPSTENLVIFIWEQIIPHINGKMKLHKIKLRETPTIFTEYYGPDGE
tara:strand:+ start:121 stop:561 length:441 start_codon:yes stop_codon:yes gene_type:complete